MKNELPLYEVTISDEQAGVQAISLVDRPAIGIPFLMFSETETEILKFAFDDDSMIITGPAMIPDLPIYRRDDERGEFEVFFSRSTVEKCALKYAKEMRNYDVNLNHDDSLAAPDTYLFESWIVMNGENDKAKVMGFDVPVGTWMVSMKVENVEFWKKLKESKITGFSIEGLFGMTQRSKDGAAQEDDDYSSLVEAVMNADEELKERLRNFLIEHDAKNANQ